MPTNDVSQYIPETEQLDQGINNIPNLFPVPDTQLTLNQNFSLNTFFDNVNSNFLKSNSWLKAAPYETPINTRLKDTQRYNDSEFGFDINNPNIEYQYGDRQSALSKWKNNVIKFGGNIIGSFLEGMATLPLVVDAAASGNIDKIENNDLTNSVTEWLDNLETQFPNYETSYQRDHPILNYIPGFGNLGDSWGGVLKNLGYTVGAIGSAIVTDMAVGAVTGGIGETPLLGTQITKIAGSIGKIFGAGTEQVQSFTKLIQGGKNIEEALSSMSRTAKVIDKTRYGLSLFTSAAAEAQVEANQLAHTLDNDLKKQFYDEHGYDAQGDDLDRINRLKKEGATASLISNIGLLMLTEGIQFESLLKPASTARAILQGKANKNVAIKLAEESLDLFEEVVPRKGLANWLGKRVTSGFAKSFGVEGFQEGSQYVISSAAEKYEKAKFNNESTDAVDNFVTSLSYGLHDVVTSREGLENLLIGGLSGAIIYPVRTFIEKTTGRYTDPRTRSAQVLQILNDPEANLTGLFSDKFNSAVVSHSLSNEMVKNLQQGDLYEYHNNKFVQLFNFVNAGIKTSRFDSQIERLQQIKDLPVLQAQTLLNIQDPNLTKSDIDAHVDSVIRKALDIKSDIDKINDSFKNPYSTKSKRFEFDAYENLKDKLSVSLSEMKDNRNRMNSLSSEISSTTPNANIDDVVNLTSPEGVNQTIKNFNSRISELSKDEELLKGEDKITAQRERKWLEKTVEELSSQDKDQYIKSVHSIYDYYNNFKTLNNKESINLIDALSNLNKANDIYKLGKGIEIAQSTFDILNNKSKFNKELEDIKQRMQAFQEANAEHVANRDNTEETPHTDTPDDQELNDNNEPVVTAPVQTVEEIRIDNEPFDPDKADLEIAAEKAKNKQPDIQSQIHKLQKDLEDDRQLVYDQAIELGESEEDANTAADEYVKKQSPIGKKIRSLQKKLGQEEKPSIKIPKEEPILPSVVKEVKKSEPIIASVQSATKGLRKYNFNPAKFVQSIFTRDRKSNGIESRNKREIISNNTPQQLASKITAKVQESKEGKKFGDYTKIADSNIYYTGYKYDMELSVDNKPIGLIQPSERLFFKDGDTYKDISELPIEKYEEVTGNSVNTYPDFMEDIRSYKAAISSIEQQFKDGKTEFSNDDLAKIISIGIAYSVPYSNTSRESTLLSDITYDNGNTVLSFPMEQDEDGNFKRTDSPTIIGQERLSQEDQEQLIDYISNNLDKFHALESRYIFVTKQPNGVYGDKSRIAARAAESSDQNIQKLLELIKRKPVDAVQAREINKELKENFYVADSTNGKGQGAKMALDIDQEGNVGLSIINDNVTYTNSKGQVVPYKRRITIEKAKQATTLAELVNIINDKLYYQKTTRKDRTLEKMGVFLTKEDFKSNILNDESVSYDELKSKLSLAVKKVGNEAGKSDIFGDSNIYIIPKNNKMKEVQITFPEVTIQSPIIKETPTETKTSTATAATFLKDKEAKEKARIEAKNQSSEEIDNEFLNSLGCK